jgi:hypothetical protein
MRAACIEKQKKNKKRKLKMEWTVIGAGPAGIATIGKLLDAGISPSEIAWMDPAFKVGDLGQKWGAVSSNTKVKLFLDFLDACNSFQYKKRPHDFELHRLDPEATCFLSCIADPLQWVTDHLKQKVRAISTQAEELVLLNRQWEIKTTKGTFFSKNVVLAIGAEASTLSLAGPKVIPIEKTLDPALLKKECSPKDTVAVFGSSHTAIIVLYNLLAAGVGKVINFYRSPLKYAVYLNDWILFDDSGLKGYSAEWARAHIDGKMPNNLQRISSSHPSFTEAFAKCNKAVYAVGFERRKLPVLTQYDKLAYNESTGIIAPGLFGIGIAFPEGKFDRLGNYEHRVGLWKFMDYLTRILPIWLRYHT